MTGVVGDCVQFYFNFLSQGTIAEGATLFFIMVPPKARCRSCDRSFELKEFDWTCPYCGNRSMEIEAGQELFVESIEVE
jgi:hydrogenase nickel incorporation protein HypA/HybF